ncbi:MerR family transcriptional regulator [Sessilibacter corallicola]|uniref:Mercuric resistance operon regulatory protein n=1 Tax=Sessilibacter corallicola TaxID=2904075 RepID=A0ABQ0A3Y8_9GAMM
MYTIGQLAGKAGVNVETIRYYERRNLLNKPVKPAQGYRQYREDALRRLVFIRRAQGLGFSLDEIADLIHLDDAACSDVRVLAEARLDSVREKIQQLRSLENNLETMVKACLQNSDEAHCPILDSFVPSESGS